MTLRSTLWWRCLAAFALTAWADFLLFQRAPGCGVTLLALPLGALAFWQHRRLPGARGWLALWLALALGASLEASLIGRALLVALLWTLLAMALLNGAQPPFLSGLLRGVAGGLRSFTALYADARRFILLQDRRISAKVPPAWVIGLPILLVAIFAALIVPANLVLSRWTVEAFNSALDWVFNLSLARLVFWFAVGTGIYGLFRFRLGRREAAARPLPSPQSDADHARHGQRACVLSFAGLNALYLAANAADFFYLWLAFELPAGMSYAEFAHHGSYRLIVAAVLAAATITVFFPTGSLQLSDKFARVLAFAFILQNLLVLGAAARRLELYVEVYGLTRFRVAALLWMLLVGVGFVLVYVRVWKELPVSFLFRTNAVSTVLLLAAVALLNLDGFIARWNVARYEEGRHREIDIAYLSDLDAPALPALARLVDIARAKGANEVALAASTRLQMRLAREQAVVREWPSWTWRRSAAVAEAQAP